MDRVRPGFGRAIIWAMIWFLYLLNADSASAQHHKNTNLIYDRPVLVLDPGMHTDQINAIAVDQQGHLVVTASADKTVRIWDVNSGTLEQTVHAPNGPGRVGEMYAVAIQADGGLVAAGGWTGDPNGSSIYLIDPSQGKIVQRIAGMPNATTRLAFSSDGRYLAAGTVGLRVFDRDKHWTAVAKDDNYSAEVYGLSFALDGRLATASADGVVRLYDAGFHFVQGYVRKQGTYPRSVAFSPDGRVLAVGYTSPLSPVLLDGRTLAKLSEPKLGALGDDLEDEVAWSRDGQTLFINNEMKVSLVSGEIVACSQAGRGNCQKLVDGLGSGVSFIATLPTGGLVVAGNGGPLLAALKADGSSRWKHSARTANFQSFHPLGKVADDGTTVDFRFQPTPQTFQFNVSRLNIVEPAASSTAHVTKTLPQLPIAIDSDGHAMNGGHAIAITASEIAESFAIHPKGDQFAIGTTGGLYLFRANDDLVWHRDLASTVHDVKITGDGNLLVAALGDGTIRWFRSDTGIELLALMPLAQKERQSLYTDVTANTLDWVAWTPDGFYTSTPGVSRTLKWVANRDAAAEAIAVATSDIPSLRRPEVLGLMLRYRDAAQALGAADLAAVRNEIKIATNAERPPGIRLHVLAIGINSYGPKATGLKLNSPSRTPTTLPLNSTRRR